MLALLLLIRLLYSFVSFYVSCCRSNYTSIVEDNPQRHTRSTCHRIVLNSMENTRK